MHTRLEQLLQPMRWAPVAVAAAAIVMLLWLLDPYWGAVYTPLLMLGVGWGIGALAGLRPRLTESPQP